MTHTSLAEMLSSRGRRRRDTRKRH